MLGWKLWFWYVLISRVTKTDTIEVGIQALGQEEFLLLTVMWKKGELVVKMLNSRFF